MSRFQPQQGFGYRGAFQMAQLPDPTQNETNIVYAFDNGEGAYLYSDGYQWRAFTGGIAPTPSFKIGIIGASTAERMNVLYGCDPTTYQRQVDPNSGLAIATITTNTTLDSPLNVGRQFRITCDIYPQIEGWFTIQSVSASGSGIKITYVDNREPIGRNQVPANAQVHYVDPAFYTVSSGVLTHLSMAVGGGIQPVVAATGSTNSIQQWMFPATVYYNRIDNLLSQGPFGLIVVGSGMLGDALLAGYGPEEIYASLVYICNRVVSSGTRVAVETINASRNFRPNSNNPTNGGTEGSIYQSGARLTRMIWRDLPNDIPNVIIIPVNETMVTNVVGTYSGAETDVQNGWPPIDLGNSDGTHYAYGMSRLIGAGAWAPVLMREVLPWDSGCYSMPDCLWNATINDGDGNPNQNAMSAWFDVVPTVTATSPVTGLMPQGCRIDVSHPSASAVGTSAVTSNSEKGQDWIVTYADSGSGSSAGPTITLAITGFTNQKFLTTLQANPGKTLDIRLPIFVADIIENVWLAFEAALYVDYGTGMQPFCGSCDIGLYRQAGIGRAMDAGFDGIFHFPVTQVPFDSANIVGAELRLSLFGVPSTSQGLNTSLGVRAGGRFDIY